ncbi:MAG: hypothetical protein LBR37_03140 [Erysipelotrichaceae bacterium]|jgi:hypothetical protein|nr:hypothetical protein [Erysipelotrichaceae bacterium]
MKRTTTIIIMMLLLISCRSPKEKSFCSYLFTNDEYYIDRYYDISTWTDSIPNDSMFFSPLEEGKVSAYFSAFHTLDESSDVINLTTKFSFFQNNISVEEPIIITTSNFFKKDYRVIIDHADSDWWSIGLSDECYVYYSTEFHFKFDKPYSLFDKTTVVRIDFTLTYENGTYYDTPCYSELLIEHIDGLTYVPKTIPNFRYIE